MIILCKMTQETSQKPKGGNLTTPYFGVSIPAITVLKQHTNLYEVVFIVEVVNF